MRRLLGAVHAAEGELAIEGAVGGGRFVKDTDRIAGNCALGEQIVGHGGHELAGGERARCEVDRANAENTVFTGSLCHLAGTGPLEYGITIAK